RPRRRGHLLVFHRGPEAHRRCRCGGRGEAGRGGRPPERDVMSGRLSGKVCIVTGTGGSMGRATAVTFAREGALLVGCDVAVEPAEETLEAVRGAGGEMVSRQPCRLSDPAECAKLVELAVSEFGRIDVLFNLAARSHFYRLE